MAVPASSRLPSARACIARNRGRGVIDPTTHSELSERLLESHRSIIELFLIAAALDGPGDSLAGVIPKAIMGHELTREDRNSEGRNFQFEVLTAALVRLAGIHGVKSREPDVLVTAGSSTIGIAAKRIVSLDRRAREKHLRKAVRQLKREGSAGFVFLNLDAVIENGFVHQGHEEAVRLLSDLTEESRKYVERVDRDGMAQGIFGFATLLGWDASSSPAALSLDVTCHAALIVPEGQQAYTLDFLGHRGRYLRETLLGLVALLDGLPSQEHL